MPPQAGQYGTDDVASLAENMGQVHKEVKSILRAKTHEIKKARLQSQEESTLASDRLQQELSKVPAPVARDGGLESLGGLGTWKNLVATVQAGALTFNIRQACERPSGGSIASLSQHWNARHHGIRRAAPKKLPGVRESACFQSGSCHCRNTPDGVRIHHMWLSAEKCLKQLFLKKSELEQLVGGDAVIFWAGLPRAAQDGNIALHVTHVSCMYLKPWRPTFLHLDPHASSDREALANIFATPGSAVPIAAPGLLTFQVRADSGGTHPAFDTQHSFMGQLSGDRDWWLMVGKLSTRQTPFLFSQGMVRVQIGSGAEKILWWSAHEASRKDGASPSEAVDGNIGDSGDERGSGNEEEEPDPDKEFDLAADVLELMEALASGTTCDKEVDGPGRSRSSSSSSSSSSTSSAKGSDAPPISERSKQQTQAEEAAVREVAGRDPAHVFSWGAHSYVQRFSGGVLAGLQMNCKLEGHDRCSKEMSFTVAGSEQNCRCLLKAWIILGQGSCRNRQEHMRGELKAVLLDSLLGGHLLEEKYLDHCVTLPAEKWVSPWNLHFKADESAKLGKKASDVPSEVHSRMLAMVRDGQLVATTPAQRDRNRRTLNTSYHVPVVLTDALAFGYISPNLPPPRGMIWRNNGGAWRLCPRGG